MLSLPGSSQVPGDPPALTVLRDKVATQLGRLSFPTQELGLFIPGHALTGFSENRSRGLGLTYSQHAGIGADIRGLGLTHGRPCWGQS